MEILVRKFQPGINGEQVFCRYSPKALYEACRCGLVNKWDWMLIEDGRPGQTWRQLNEYLVRALLPFVIHIARAGSVIGTYEPQELLKAYNNGLVTNSDYMFIDDGFHDGENWQEIRNSYSIEWLVIRREDRRQQGFREAIIVNEDGTPFYYKNRGHEDGFLNPRPPKKIGDD